MSRIILVIMVFVIFFSTAAMARNFPVSVVQTKDDFFLVGQPKRVLIQNSSDTDSGLIEDKFNRDGILMSHMVGGGELSSPFETEIRNGRLIEVSYSPSLRSDAPATKSLQYDKQGRTTAFKGVGGFGADSYYRGSKHSITLNPMSGAADSPSLVRMVHYEPNRQVHDLYVNRALFLKVAFNFSDQDKLLNAQCLAGDCENFIDLQYGENGLLSAKSTVSETTYHYEQGLLDSRSVRSKAGKQVGTTYYGDYKFDECGNWTQQAIFSQPPSEVRRQRIGLTLRKIEYYTQCQSVSKPSSHLTCPSMLTYRIGNVDHRFGLSVGQFQDVVREAAALWNAQAGRPLLEYSEDGSVPVNLVYDERQENTQNMRGVANSILADKGEYTKKLKQYDEFVAAVNQKKSDYERRASQNKEDVDDFNRTGSELAADIKSYEEKSIKLSAKKNISQEDVDEINKEREVLQSRQQAIQVKQELLRKQYELLGVERETVNGMVVDANAQAAKLQNIGARAGAMVDALKQNKYAGKEFHAGVFRVEGDKRWIDIYSFDVSSHLTDLKLGLAHEFGHALGFDHVEEPEAVMHYKTGRNTFKLASSDIGLLSKQCAKK